MEITSGNVGTQLYFMPHHVVFLNVEIKIYSLTTKIHVVFDATCETDSGLSLNDLLVCYWKNLPFKMNWFAFCPDSEHINMYCRLLADIKQIYRQIWVFKTLKTYKKILWRFKPDDNNQDSRLSVKMLTVRNRHHIQQTGCLKQLSDEYKTQYSVASE